MIVRSVAEIEDGDRDVKTPNWRSKRIVLAKEGVGFSVHETTLYPGTVNDFWYANHIEAVFVVEGEGELLDKETGIVHQLAPGTLYLLDGNERHQLRPTTLMRTVCVFNPPVTGAEVHDENGVYPLIVEEVRDPADEPAAAG
ncbi:MULTISPECIES: ectoine synthase [Actinoalloteichus]|uniref:L-ectoine synthase n=1 Tax=Actinoalloteichus fjordicus TaxID=1612552 RepID=A0AAC9L940_9PSEU|nr:MULTISPECIES: ectoine synthase [Actinoalloteichus]APU13453.1 Ectoine synthase [Actinoalloteichus fjordicus]APU19402.1 Ectoine synthase [Actinoalloteichus sp. GBA129-24]